jgi:hypothetical protein
VLDVKHSHGEAFAVVAVDDWAPRGRGPAFAMRP